MAVVRRIRNRKSRHDVHGRIGADILANYLSIDDDCEDDYLPRDHMTHGQPLNTWLVQKKD